MTCAAYHLISVAGGKERLPPACKWFNGVPRQGCLERRARPRRSLTVDAPDAPRPERVGAFGQASIRPAYHRRGGRPRKFQDGLSVDAPTSETRKAAGPERVPRVDRRPLGLQRSFHFADMLAPRVPSLRGLPRDLVQRRRGSILSLGSPLFGAGAQLPT